MMPYDPFASVPLADSGGTVPEDVLAFNCSETFLAQYANSDIMRALMTTFNTAIDKLAAFNQFIDWIWNIETARGFGLDIWGRILGVRRNLYIIQGKYLGFAGASSALSFDAGVLYRADNSTNNYAMTDVVYRRVLLAKAAFNITDCAIPSINKILMAVFPDYGNVYVIDNGDMTMEYHFPHAPSTVDYAIATQSGVLPKPTGVSVTVTY